MEATVYLSSLAGLLWVIFDSLCLGLQKRWARAIFAAWLIALLSGMYMAPWPGLLGLSCVILISSLSVREWQLLASANGIRSCESERRGK